MIACLYICIESLKIVFPKEDKYILHLRSQKEFLKLNMSVSLINKLSILISLKRR